MGGVPLPVVPCHAPHAAKNQIPGLLRSLTATHRITGVPEVPVKALARHLGVHRRTLYKVAEGAPCSDALATRLLGVLGQIYRCELVFERKVNGPWQPRHVQAGEVRRARKVHSFSITLTTSGPRLRLVRLP